MNWWKIITLIIIAIALFFLGFLTYKWTHKPEVIIKTEYIKGETIRDSIPIPYPDIQYITPDTLDVIKQVLASGKFKELFPELNHDSSSINSKDTSLILHDWMSLRIYNDTLMDNDTLGFLEVNSQVQYNRLSKLEYTFTPIQKIETIEKKYKHAYTPYFSAGIVTTPAVIAQAGLFIDNWGFAGQYQYDWKLNSHNGGILIVYKIDIK